MPETAPCILPDETTIIWDLDGTILDSLGVLDEGLQEVLPQYGITPPTHKILAVNFHGSLEDTIHNALGGELSASKLNRIVQDFLRVQDSYYEVVEHHLYPDALNLMKRLHSDGKQQILVTNRAHEGRLRASPRSIVAHSELGDYIDAVGAFGGWLGIACDHRFVFGRCDGWLICYDGYIGHCCWQT